MEPENTIAQLILVLIFLISFVVIIIVTLFRKKKEKDSSLKTKLTMGTIASLSEELLKNAYYFLSEELTLKRIDEQNEKTSESGRMVLKSSSLENQVIITTKTKGKLLSVNDNEIRIQFDTQEDCSLSFKDEIDGFYLNADGDKVIYNKNEYTVDCKPMVLYKLVNINSYKTIKNKAKGAW